MPSSGATFVSGGGTGVVRATSATPDDKLQKSSFISGI